MSELNIDTADRSTLEQVAEDAGIKYQANTGDDTLRKRIKEALGEIEPGDGITGAPTPQNSATPTSADENKAEAPGEKAKAKRYRVIVATHDQDKQPVQVGVNGRTYVIERGKEVVVPESVVEVLTNAVQHQYDPATMKETRVMAYPFQNLGEA